MNQRGVPEASCRFCVLQVGIHSDHFVRVGLKPDTLAKVFRGTTLGPVNANGIAACKEYQELERTEQAPKAVA